MANISYLMATTAAALAIVLLSLPATTAVYQTCEEGARFEPVPGDCGSFVACVGPKGYKMPCPTNLVFSLSAERCVYTSVESLAECVEIEMELAQQTQEATSGGLLGLVEEKADAGNSRSQNSNQMADKAKPKDITVPENRGRKDKKPDRMDKEEETSSSEDGTGSSFLEKLLNKDMMEDELPDSEMTNDMINAIFEKEKRELAGGRFTIAQEQKCVEGVTMAPHDTFCHRYFDCSAPYDDKPLQFLQPYEKECPYPQLFSTETNQCEDYEKVDCGTRKSFSDPCDYAANKCWGPNCRSCRSQFASCREQSDGVMYWPGREGTGFWVECRDGRNVRQGDCGHDQLGRMKVFDSDKGECVMYHEHVGEMCQWTGGAYDLPHHTDCHRYYDCTSPSASDGQGRNKLFKGSEGSVATCPYPQLFSVSTGKCEDFDQVDCGTRREAFTPCEYMTCEDPNLASCFGLPDGENVCRTKEGSPHYVTCRNQRTVAKHMCPVDGRGLYMQFAPGARRCLPVDATEAGA